MQASNPPLWSVPTPPPAFSFSAGAHFHGASSEKFGNWNIPGFLQRKMVGVFFHIGAALQRQGSTASHPSWSWALPHSLIHPRTPPPPGAFCSGALSLPQFLGWYLPQQTARRFFSIS